MAAGDEPTSAEAATSPSTGGVLNRAGQNNPGAGKTGHGRANSQRELTAEEQQQKKRDDEANANSRINSALGYEFKNRNWKRWRLMSEVAARELRDKQAANAGTSLEQEAMLSGNFTHLQEGTYTLSIDDENIERLPEENEFNIEVRKNDAGGFSVWPVPPPKSIEGKARAFGMCMDLLLAKGFGMITIDYPDTDWTAESNQLARKLATETLMVYAFGVSERGATVPGAEEMSPRTRALLNSYPRRKPGAKTLLQRLDEGELLSYKKIPEDQETYYEMMALINQNSERTQLMSGKGTTEYFKGLSEDLGARSVVSEDSYKKQLEGLTGNEKQTAIDKGLAELAKRAEALDKVREQYSKGMENLDKQYGNPENLAGRLQKGRRIFKEEKKSDKNFNHEKALEQIHKNVAENHLPAAEELRVAIEKEQKNLEAMEAALKGELGVTDEAKAEAVAGVDVVEPPVTGVAAEAAADAVESNQPDLEKELKQTSSQLEDAKAQLTDKEEIVKERQEAHTKIFEEMTEAMGENPSADHKDLIDKSEKAEKALNDAKREVGDQKIVVQLAEEKCNEILEEMTKRSRLVDERGEVKDKTAEPVGTVASRVMDVEVPAVESPRQTQEKQPEKKSDVEPSQPASKATPEQQQKLEKIQKQLQATKDAVEKAKTKENKLKGKYPEQEKKQEQDASPGLGKP